MTKKNYLIGRAEVLTELTPPPKISPKSNDIYTLTEVIERLAPQFEQVARELAELSDELCPRDYSVARLTLHPSYIAKGHFPKKLLREIGVRSIGSAATEVTPDKWTRKGEPQKSPTTCLYVAGKRTQIANFSQRLTSYREEAPAAGDLSKVWSLESVSPKSKVKPGFTSHKKVFEVGLQLIPGTASEFIKASFLKYATNLGFEAHDEISFHISNLWFVPLTGSDSELEALAMHSFVRVVRPMPELRSFTPIVRNMPVAASASLPSEPPVADDVRVAILDGGLPNRHFLQPWVNDYKKSDPAATDCIGGTSHGLGVTSAFLFGPIRPSSAAQRPFSKVDHHRVLDSGASSEDPLELYRTLGHIEDILLSRQYEFINISLGPNLPIDDDEIHPWTSLLDSYLADGETFLTIAAGNNGEGNAEFGLNRIQVPSDSVNAVAVGAANKTGSDWARASYSAWGPGRAPGRTKPDIISFGGSPDEYFHVVADSTALQLMPQQGTSFSAPYVLRKAVGVRALLGHEISPLAIKALLVNSASTSIHDQSEVGWGKAPDDINQLIESPDGVARILYQGELVPGKYLKVPLPLPEDGINGTVKIRATCCIATPIDPQDTSMYTKAGIEISWSPKEGGKPEPFFKQVKVATEAELRRDAAKWESVLHAEKNKRGSSLSAPSFELHYMARDGGGAVSGSMAPTIKYAFVVTIEAPKHKQIFNDILSAYSEVLTEIKPRVSVPVQTQV